MLNIRQIALVARHDLVAAQEFIDVLGLAIAFHDPSIKNLGLHNTLMPIGTQLLEIVAPITEGTTAERYLLRRKGAGGYMVITQTDNHPHRRARVDDLAIRIVGQFDEEGFTNMQLHPADTGGSFLEIDQQAGGEDPMGPWSPAGQNWQQAIRTDLVSAITAAEMQCDDPEKVATRWSEIIEIDRSDIDGVPTIPLDNATLRFVPIVDGRPEGLAGIDLACSAPDTVRENAARRKLPVTDDYVVLAGMRCYPR
jgi:hypothetical protein